MSQPASSRRSASAASSGAAAGQRATRTGTRVHRGLTCQNCSMLFLSRRGVPSPDPYILGPRSLLGLPSLLHTLHSLGPTAVSIYAPHVWETVDLPLTCGVSDIDTTKRLTAPRQGYERPVVMARNLSARPVRSIRMSVAMRSRRPCLRSSAWPRGSRRPRPP